MATYWIVVPRANQDLFDLLSLAFQGRSGFTVIEDRRSREGHGHDLERRAGIVELGRDEIVVAEQAHGSGQRLRGVEASRTPVRLSAHRRTARRSVADRQRLVTL